MDIHAHSASLSSWSRWRIGLTVRQTLIAPSLSLLCLANILSSLAAAQLDETYELPRYLGRTIAPTMGYGGAWWLTREEREREEQPAKLLKALQLKKGQAVCDFGCGNGYYTLQLASRIGPTGKVYAVDIQPEMLEKLRTRAEPRALENIVTVLAKQDDPGLGEASLDLILMVDVYHELADPPTILAAVRKSLRPKGRVAVVEFRKEDPDVPIQELHKMTQPQVLKEFAANRFKLVGQFDQLPWQHVLFFARSDSPLEAKDLAPWNRVTATEPQSE